MDQLKVVNNIVEQLSKAVPKDNIITELCEQENINWNEAQSLVEKVQQENRLVISRRQFPLMSVIAVIFFLAGFGLLIFAIVSMVKIIEIYSASQLPPLDLAQITLYIFNYGYGLITACILGMGMILGSLIGMRQAWAEILDIS